MAQTLFKKVEYIPAPLQLNTKLKCVDIFFEKDNYLDKLRLFYAYFDKVPSVKSICNIDCSALRRWLDKSMRESIICSHTYEQYNRDKGKMTCRNILYVMNNELLLTMEKDTVEIVYANGNGHLAQQLIDGVKRFIKKAKRTTDINMIIAGGYHLSTMPIKINKPTLNVSTHYNDDFALLHANILSNLNKKNAKGLYLFHGLPGTGKSTYIRYLIHHLKRKVIFMSPTQAANLESPEFSLFLIENRQSVIVIEDAEELIVSRDSKRISSISTLLNLSDGLLAESLGIQVIASFNTNITNIDKALLRKGRLTALYEFKELSIIKAAGLIEALGFKNHFVTKPMTLADIYNIEETAFQLKPERNAIGFLVNNN